MKPIIRVLKITATGSMGSAVISASRIAKYLGLELGEYITVRYSDGKVTLSA